MSSWRVRVGWPIVLTPDAGFTGAGARTGSGAIGGEGGAAPSDSGFNHHGRSPMTHGRSPANGSGAAATEWAIGGEGGAARELSRPVTT
jgi:hypothetical protein